MPFSLCEERRKKKKRKHSPLLSIPALLDLLLMIFHNLAMSYKSWK